MFNESSYENSVIELFKTHLSYDYAYGPDIDRDFLPPHDNLEFAHTNKKIG